MKQTQAEIVLIKKAVRGRDGNRCVHCSLSGADYQRVTGKNLDVHRTVPGSPYTLEGCVTVCPRCHKRLPRSAPNGRDFQAVVISRETHRRLKMIAAELQHPVLAGVSAILEDLVAIEFSRLRLIHRKWRRRTQEQQRRQERNNQKAKETRRLRKEQNGEVIRKDPTT